MQTIIDTANEVAMYTAEIDELTKKREQARVDRQIIINTRLKKQQLESNKRSLTLAQERNAKFDSLIDAELSLAKAAGREWYAQHGAAGLAHGDGARAIQFHFDKIKTLIIGQLEGERIVNDLTNRIAQAEGDGFNISPESGAATAAPIALDPHIEATGEPVPPTLAEVESKIKSLKSLLKTHASVPTSAWDSTLRESNEQAKQRLAELEKQAVDLREPALVEVQQGLKAS